YLRWLLYFRSKDFSSRLPLASLGDEFRFGEKATWRKEDIDGCEENSSQLVL
ncbi:hypothetical protein EJB05_47216, partial [Eragrostis curvula]